ncbi:hypothetical protein [uncultured Flavobacterium sp.]|nr:hypothetical protein [uncultured Flavobacterium sp.]
MNGSVYIIAKVKVLPYSICPEMIYPLEIHGFSDTEEDAKKRAKKIQ